MLLVIKGPICFWHSKATKRPKTPIQPMRVITDNHLLSLSSFFPIVFFLSLFSLSFYFLFPFLVLTSFSLEVKPFTFALRCDS